jgi:hypothetical protein
MGSPLMVGEATETHSSRRTITRIPPANAARKTLCVDRELFFSDCNQIDA